MWIVDRLNSNDIAKLFRSGAAVNIRRYWPPIQNELKRTLLGQNKIMIAYTIATIRAETGLFAPIDERLAPANTVSSDRPFGTYDRPKLTPDGHVAQLKDKKGRPRYDARGRPVYTDLGNHPNLKGTANETDHNEWNYYRAWGSLPDSPVHNSTLARLAVGAGPKHAPIPLVDYKDGERFRGRGFIQLTGRDNYEVASREVGVDLINDPDKANDPQIAARLVGWFLTRPGKVRTIERCLSPEQHKRDYSKARAAVNGGKHGLQSFTDTYKAAENALLQKEIDLVKWLAAN
jgi:predicted chitinase